MKTTLDLKNIEILCKNVFLQLKYDDIYIYILHKLLILFKPFLMKRFTWFYMEIKLILISVIKILNRFLFT